MSFDSPLPPYNASDPGATFLNSSCLDLLLIELVPMAYRLANELQTGDRSESVLVSGAERAEGERGAGSTTGGAGGTEKTAGGGGGGGAQSKLDEDEERDAVFYRLEMLGYRVGQSFVERYVLHLAPFLCWGSWTERRICMVVERLAFGN
jgi:trafficking protein particle complex subunit 6